MTVRDLKDQLDAFDNNMEVVIGIRQRYGINLAMEMDNNLDEYNVTAIGGEDGRGSCNYRRK